jgi:hypothetical protein
MRQKSWGMMQTVLTHFTGAGAAVAQGARPEGPMPGSVAEFDLLFGDANDRGVVPVLPTTEGGVEGAGRAPDAATSVALWALVPTAAAPVARDDSIRILPGELTELPAMDVADDAGAPAETGEGQAPGDLSDVAGLLIPLPFPRPPESARAALPTDLPAVVPLASRRVAATVDAAPHPVGVEEELHLVARETAAVPVAGSFPPAGDRSLRGNAATTATVPAPSSAVEVPVVEAAAVAAPAKGVGREIRRPPAPTGQPAPLLDRPSGPMPDTARAAVTDSDPQPVVTAMPVGTPDADQPLPSVGKISAAATVIADRQPALAATEPPARTVPVAISLWEAAFPASPLAKIPGDPAAETSDDPSFVSPMGATAADPAKHAKPNLTAGPFPTAAPAAPRPDVAPAAKVASAPAGSGPLDLRGELPGASATAPVVAPSRKPAATVPLPDLLTTPLAEMLTDQWPENLAAAPLTGMQISPSNPQLAPLPVGPAVTHLAAQVVAGLVAPKPGVTEISLAPEELGHVKLRLQADSQNPDRMIVMLSFDRPETLDLFRRHADQLAGVIRSAGYSGVDIGFAQQGQGDRAPPGDGRAATGPDLIDQPDSETTDSATPVRRSHLPDTGLDLRL